MRVRSTTGRVEKHPNPVTVSAVHAAIETLLQREGECDGLSLTGGEPLLQADFLVALLDGGHLPRPRILETAGVLPRALARLLPLIDMVSMDIKLPSNSGEKPFWREHEEFLRLAAGKVYAKILVDRETSIEEVARAAALVRQCAAGAPVFLQPITVPGDRLALGAEELTSFYAAARKHGDDVRIVPQVHPILGIR